MVHSCARIALFFLDSETVDFEQIRLPVFNCSSERILEDAVDCRLVAVVAEWLLGKVLLDVCLGPADLSSSSMRPVI